MSGLGFFLAHAGELGVRSGEHVVLCVATLSGATLIGLPIGALLANRPRLAAGVLAVCSTIQTVPSLALLGFLMVVTGRIGWAPSLVALLLYALLPILRNTVVGLRSTPPTVQQAAIALGMTEAQVLWEVSLPLAMPVVIGGLRTAAVWTVGTATLCAFIGAGGLGVFINRGIESVDGRLVLLGVVPAATLALLVDLLFAWMGRRLAPPGTTA
jgi:osmoprotectant transport system permease protein